MMLRLLSLAVVLAVASAQCAENPALPASVVDSLIVRLNAREPSTLLMDNAGRVSRWEDTENNLFFENNNRDRQPRWIADRINGFGAVQFDGVDDYLERLGNIRTELGGVHVVAVAMRPDAGSRLYQRLMSSHNDDPFLDDWISPNWNFEGPRSLSGEELSFDLPTILDQAHEGVSIQNLRLATKWNLQWTSAIEFGEILVFNRVLTEGELKLVKSDFLDCRWGFDFVPRADPPYDVPTAGYANYAARTIAGEFDEPVVRFARATQVDNMWTNLGSHFTVEGTFSFDPPQFNQESGACCAFPDDTPFKDVGIDVNQFLPIISRHPGGYLNNAFAHFTVQLSRVRLGTVLVAMIGCGCVDDNDESTCDVGYTLSSDDASMMPDERIYIQPDQFYHFAITVDGDGTSTGLENRLAKLYINGKFVHNNTWADPVNQSPFSQPGVCVGRAIESNPPMPAGGGWPDQVRVGMYRNHDGIEEAEDPGMPVMRDYGMTGKVDEVRIWNYPRSSRQIADWYDIAFTDDWLPQAGLVAYYTFDERDGLHAENMVGTGGVPEMVQDGEATESREFFGTPFPTEAREPLLAVHSRIDVVGARAPNTPEVTTFTLAGFFPEDTEPLQFEIEAISPVLQRAIDEGFVRIDRPRVGQAVGCATCMLPTYDPRIDETEILQIRASCPDATCGILGEDWRSTFVQYRAFLTDGTVGLPARVYFVVHPDCDGEVDDCGVCNGDNRSCQCVWYLNFQSSRMSLNLATWSMEHIIEKSNATIAALQDTLDVIQNPLWDQSDVGVDIIDRIEYMMNFYNVCLNDYCHAVDDFMQQLTSFMDAKGIPYSLPGARSPAMMM